MPDFKETAKMLARALRDQGTGRVSLVKQRPKKRKKKLTAAEKRLIRLKKGFPLSSGRTPKA